MLKMNSWGARPGSLKALEGLVIPLNENVLPSIAVGGEQMATQECGTGKAEIMKNLRTEGVAWSSNKSGKPVYTK